MRFSLLKEKFGERYNFSFEPMVGQYLNARLKKGAQMRANDDEEIYKTFFFADHEKRELRKSEFVYPNLYDDKYNFRHQLGYSTSLNKFVMSKTEHY